MSIKLTRYQWTIFGLAFVCAFLFTLVVGMIFLF